MVKVNSKFLKEQHPDTKLATLTQLALAAKDIDEVMSFVFRYLGVWSPLEASVQLVQMGFKCCSGLVSYAASLSCVTLQMLHPA